jgi:hypothetical protein
LRHTIQAVVIGLLSLAALCLGYGGFEVTAAFVDFKGLNQDLTYLNQAPPDTGWGGHGEFTYKAPLWWYGGHGGEHVGPVTLGGSGAVAARANQADSLGSELAAIRANFEVGFPYSPVERVWVRPTLELAGTGLVIYAHSKENGAVVGNFSANFKRWFATWGIGAVPGVEVMGSLPVSTESFIGLFVKASYFIPVSGSAWFGDKNPPDFDLGGFAIQVGLRFGKTVSLAEGDGFEY